MEKGILSIIFSHWYDLVSGWLHYRYEFAVMIVNRLSTLQENRQIVDLRVNNARIYI